MKVLLRRVPDTVLVSATQFSKAPVPIIGTFVLFSVASLIPMLKGVPRYGGGHWGGLEQFTPDAEITVGRIAMLVRHLHDIMRHVWLVSVRSDRC